MTDFTQSFAAVRSAIRAFGHATEAATEKILQDLSREILASTTEILRANLRDLKRIPAKDPLRDRLQVSLASIDAMAAGLLAVSRLPSPVHQVLDQRILTNGLRLQKLSVPFGVVGVIYESRPNVTVDAVGLCLRSGNACILRGGSEAQHSNRVLVRIIHRVLTSNRIDPRIVLLLPSSRDAVHAMFHAVGDIDVLIPRGGRQLIKAVRAQSKVPVIETGAGVVHTYIDESADLDKAQRIVCNGKTRRPSVCNSLDTLLIHRVCLPNLPNIIAPLLQHRVEILADHDTYRVLKGKYDDSLLYPASSRDFGIEFLSLRMSIKTVNDLDDAIHHIAKYSSRHSEAVVSENPTVVGRFLTEIDAAVVYANASTAFTDGACFGMGAEIGISTQKLHARGPIGLKELTTTKWQVYGTGQVRTG